MKIFINEMIHYIYLQKYIKLLTEEYKYKSRKAMILSIDRLDDDLFILLYNYMNLIKIQFTKYNLRSYVS